MEVEHPSPPAWALRAVKTLESQRTRHGPDDYRMPEQLADLARMIAEVPRCETCGWWRLLQADRNPHGGLCALGSWIGYNIDQSPPAHERSKAHATGDLFTAPDFGCVQWEAKGDE